MSIRVVRSGDRGQTGVHMSLLIRSPRRHRATVIAGMLVAGSLILAACGGDPEPAPTTTSASPTVSADAPSPDPTVAGPGIPAGASPLSGKPGGADKPVIALKIDNTRAAQPHTGLREADLVYVQEVEWGLTRLLALYNSEIPELVGPLRSARVSDIDLLRAFGSIPFAYSGAQSRLMSRLAESTFIDAPATRVYSGWFDDPARPSPVNHMLRPQATLEAFPESAVAKDMGLVFSEEPPAGGEVASEVGAQWGSSSISFTWDSEQGNYIVGFDGAQSRSTEGEPQRAATVVIQSVKQSDSGFGDRYGGVTPQVKSVGTGSALVFRDGKVWEVSWERPDPTEGTRFLLPDGSPIPFAIGQQWIVLLDQERSPVIR
jgi:hypothetical protein